MQGEADKARKLRLTAKVVWERYSQAPEVWQHLVGGRVEFADGSSGVVLEVCAGTPYPILNISRDTRAGELYRVDTFSGEEGATALEVDAAQHAKMEQAAADAAESEARAKAARESEEKAREHRAAFLAAVERESLDELCRRRGIVQLVHFTRLENLPSILRHGLIPRSLHYRLEQKPVVNDQERFDKRPDATSFSISHINEPLLHRWWNRSEWVILLAHPSLLWTHECEPFYRNAARGSGACQVRLRTPRRPRAIELERLFDLPDPRSCPVPDARRLHRDCDTTDPQAEIMVYGKIPVTSLQAIVIPSETFRERAERATKVSQLSIDVRTDSSMFQRRPCSQLIEDLGFPDVEGFIDDVYSGWLQPLSRPQA